MNKHLSFVFLLFFILTGCNGPQETSQVQPESSETAGSPIPNHPGAVFKTAVIGDGAGGIAAYVVSFQDYGQILVYIPSVDRYAEIDPRTGTYTLAFVFFTGANGTGSAISGAASAHFYGEVGKSVLFDGTVYYQATSSVGSTSIVSYRANGVAQNYGSPISVSGLGLVSLTTTVRPYDFTLLAPLQIAYQ